MDLQGTEEDPLQAALATAFTDSPISHRRSMPAATSSASAAPDAPPEAESERNDEAWKEHYDELLAGWRAESAAAREKAEQERERWKVIREKEEEEEKKKRAQLDANQKDKETEWETVERARKSKEPKAEVASDQGKGTGQRLSAAKEAAAAIYDAPPSHGSPSPTDVRDLVTGETSRAHGIESLESLLPRPELTSSEYATSRPLHADASVSATTPPSNTDDQALTGSRTWEKVPSLDSSFPSLSFHDRSMAPSPEPHEPSKQQPPAPPSVTLAIFDTSLSVRTRTLALVSSLAINLFLPFINGMMLGFGEIFAKNVLVGYFGWKIPSFAVGIRAAPKRRRD